MRRPEGDAEGMPPNPRKPIIWLGSVLEVVRDFPEPARRMAGRQLRKLQDGEPTEDWKPMSGVGQGTIELRLRTASDGRHAYRVFVVVKFEEAIYVLHAFEKKSQKTPQRELELAARRYHALIEERRNR